MLSTLDKKLLADLGRLRGQVVTIALVIACGIASYVVLHGNSRALQRAQAAFYEAQRFGDVFAWLERAPRSLLGRVETIPGVERVSARVQKPATLLLPEEPLPIPGEVVGIPGRDAAGLNALALRDGRLPEPGQTSEAVLLAGFADARGIGPGALLPTVVNGERRELRVVGLALSPEYVMAIAPGELSADPARVFVAFMNQDAVAAAFDMVGAFNQLSLALAPGADEDQVKASLDRLLSPYGGLGAKSRARQMSHYMLTAELEQLRGMSTLLPMIFLAVAALLVNVVLARLVQLQQPELATLKAVGYTSFEVSLHLLKLVLVVAGLGALIGLSFGAWFGGKLTGVYDAYFKFPNLRFQLSVADAAVVVGISWLAAALGAFSVVRRVARLPPAEAMRPPTPPRYRRALPDRIGLGRLIGPSLQMVVRELWRRPLRLLGSVLAIGAGTGLSVVGAFYYDGVEALLQTQFETVMREDVAVSLASPLPSRAARELEHLPGVLRAEGLRNVPVRFRHAHHAREGVLIGYPPSSDMRTLRDQLGREVALPADGVVLTDKLAEILEVRVGDTVTLDILEGQRGSVSVHVSGLVSESFGLQGHMRSPALHELLHQESQVSLVLLQTDPRYDGEIDARLKAVPAVASVTRRAELLQAFRSQSASMILVAAGIITLFAGIITVGVVYNNARIALAVRARDLASLRVLGFTRGEVSSVLLGEIAIQVLLALPLGLLAGRVLVHALTQMADPETYRLPLLLTPRSYAFAVLVTLLAAATSALLVRRRVDRLDLIAVLKTRD
jgi:putative ABC transport system permease protein